MTAEQYHDALFTHREQVETPEPEEVTTVVEFRQPGT
jgi:hypothetical protein